MGITLDQTGQGGQLGLVDDADQNIGLPAGVQALGGDQCGAVVQILDNSGRDLLGVVGDDLATDGAAAAFAHLVRHGGGHEAIKDAQDHRLDLMIVDKVAGESHQHIDGKDDIEEVQLRTVFVDDGSHKIGAAAAGAGFHQRGVNHAIDQAGAQGAQDLTGAVGGFVSKAGQIQLLQQNQKHGERCHIQHTSNRNRLANLEVSPDSQRNVDDQAQITHIDAKNMLDHSADTVDACGSEAVAENKKLIAECIEQSQTDDQQIGHGFFAKFHGTHSRTLLKQRPKTDFCFNLIYHIPPARSSEIPVQIRQFSPPPYVCKVLSACEKAPSTEGGLFDLMPSGGPVPGRPEYGNADDGQSDRHRRRSC